MPCHAVIRFDYRQLNLYLFLQLFIVLYSDLCFPYGVRVSSMAVYCQQPYGLACYSLSDSCMNPTN